MIVGGLKANVSRRQYRIDKCEIHLIHTKSSQPPAVVGATDHVLQS
jgi:hypothetical protein